MNICIFEDKKYINFLPLTLSRPIFELITGTKTVREKLCQYFTKDDIFLSTRTYLANVFKEKIDNVSFDIPSKPTLFINGRVIPNKSLIESISHHSEEQLFFVEETLVAARVRDGKKFYKKWEEGNLEGYKIKKIDAKTINYPWDLLLYNGEEIEKEFMLFGRNIPAQKNVVLLGDRKIFISKEAIIMPGTVIDAEDGPVIIDNGTRVMPNSFLKGPLYIGKNCLIKAGSRIYGPTSIGDVCKVGGEVEGTIFQGYSNKQHDGFTGHSYIGEWVNIGADTNNSDLKNNYKEVTVYINNKPVNTKLASVGMFIGDHSKTAINTMINTGTVIGFSANIFGEGFPPKFVPSFSWGGKRRFSVYKLEDAIETAKRVMERRNVTMTGSYRKMMKRIFEETKSERNYGT